MAEDLGKRLEQLDKEIAALGPDIKEAGSEYRKAPSGSELKADWKLELDRLVAKEKDLLRQREELQAKLGGNVLGACSYLCSGAVQSHTVQPC